MITVSGLTVVLSFVVLVLGALMLCSFLRSYHDTKENEKIRQKIRQEYELQAPPKFRNDSYTADGDIYLGRYTPEDGECDLYFHEPSRDLVVRFGDGWLDFMGKRVTQVDVDSSGVLAEAKKRSILRGLLTDEEV